MKESIKRLSVRSVEKLIKPYEIYELGFVNGEEEITVSFTPRITLQDRVVFAEAVAVAITNVGTSTGETTVSYAVKDFMIRKCTFEYYTNIRMPESTDKLYDLCYNTGIYEKIINDSRFDLLNYKTLLDEVELQIQYEILKLQNKFAAETEDFIYYIKAEATKLFDIFETMSESFKNIDPKDIEKILPKLAELKELNEKKLVEAFVDKKEST